jgi:hypothetical protein
MTNNKQQITVELSMDDKVTMVFKNKEGKTASVEIKVSELISNYGDQFWDMLEDRAPMPAIGTKEYENRCAMSPNFGDYVISKIITKGGQQ